MPGTFESERVQEALSVERQPITLVINGVGVNLSWKPNGLMVALKDGTQEPGIGGAVDYPWFAMPPNVRLCFQQGHLILKIRSSDGKYVEQVRLELKTDLSGFPDEITVSWGSA